MSWTNERIELLQKLRLDGWSASRIDFDGDLGGEAEETALFLPVMR